MASLSPAAGIQLTPGQEQHCHDLSLRLKLPLITQAEPEPALDYLFVYSAEGLKLYPQGKKASGPLWVNFVSGKAAHRRQYGGGRSQLIAKATGMKSGLKPNIVDATAGLGQDAFVLASLGANVLLIERSPWVFELLQDGLARAKAAADLDDITARMTLIAGDAATILPSHSNADVIYLDPMFPERQKSAQVKKEMLHFRQLVGADHDADQLLQRALEAAPSRVVVKRPRKAPHLASPPTYSLEGKSSRYDIYALKGLNKAKGKPCDS